MREGEGGEGRRGGEGEEVREREGGEGRRGRSGKEGVGFGTFLTNCLAACGDSEG